MSGQSTMRPSAALMSRSSTVFAQPTDVIRESSMPPIENANQTALFKPVPKAWPLSRPSSAITVSSAVVLDTSFSQESRQHAYDSSLPPSSDSTSHGMPPPQSSPATPADPSQRVFEDNNVVHGSTTDTNKEAFMRSLREIPTLYDLPISDLESLVTEVIAEEGFAKLVGGSCYSPNCLTWNSPARKFGLVVEDERRIECFVRGHKSSACLQSGRHLSPPTFCSVLLCFVEAAVIFC